jgi:hypothetical protein
MTHEALRGVPDLQVDFDDCAPNAQCTPTPLGVQESNNNRRRRWSTKVHRLADLYGGTAAMPRWPSAIAS